MHVRYIDRETGVDEVFSVNVSSFNPEKIERAVYQKLDIPDDEIDEMLGMADGDPYTAGHKGKVEGFDYFISEMSGADMPAIFIIGDRNQTVDVDQFFDEDGTLNLPRGNFR